MKPPRALHAVGVSFRAAPVALRERLAFRAADVPRALGELHARGCHEVAILSTCNRVEIYAVGEAGEPPLSARLTAFLAEFHGVPPAEFAGVVYGLKDAEVARHLFEVAASLDSQVLGETEILGQAREAYRLAAEAGTAGPVLRGLFERAFFLAKELRGAGGVGEGLSSISSAAVKLAGKIFDRLERHSALVLGTGEMAAGIVKSLQAAGVKDFLVASRTRERGDEFARATGSRCGSLENLPGLLTAADIVLVSTAAPHYIVTPEHLQAALPGRHGRPLFLIDISVPRNVDPVLNRVPGIFLYDIDDLEEVAREGREQREKAAAHWRPRLADEARALLNELQDEEPDEAARRLLRKAEALRREALENLRRGGKVDEATAGELARALELFQARLLHGPLATLKEAARAGDGAITAEWVARLFRLQSGEKSSPAPSGAPAEPEEGKRADRPASNGPREPSPPSQAGRQP